MEMKKHRLFSREMLVWSGPKIVKKNHGHVGSAECPMFFFWGGLEERSFISETCEQGFGMFLLGNVWVPWNRWMARISHCFLKIWCYPKYPHLKGDRFDNLSFLVSMLIFVWVGGYRNRNLFSQTVDVRTNQKLSGRGGSCKTPVTFTLGVSR